MRACFLNRNSGLLEVAGGIIRPQGFFIYLVEGQVIAHDGSGGRSVALLQGFINSPVIGYDLGIPNRRVQRRSQAPARR